MIDLTSGLFVIWLLWPLGDKRPLILITVSMVWGTDFPTDRVVSRLGGMDCVCFVSGVWVVGGVVVCGVVLGRVCGMNKLLWEGVCGVLIFALEVGSVWVSCFLGGT